MNMPHGGTRHVPCRCVRSGPAGGGFTDPRGGEESSPFAALCFAVLLRVCVGELCSLTLDLCGGRGGSPPRPGVDERPPAPGEGRRRGLPGEGASGAWREGRVQRVAGCLKPQPSGRGGAGSGVVSQVLPLKRPAEAPCARPALAAQTCRAGLALLECSSSSSGRGSRAAAVRSPPRAPGRPRPSRSRPSPRPPRSPGLSLPLARALIFFCCRFCRCRGAAGRPHLGRLRQLPGSRPAPFPPAWTLGSAAARAGLAAAPQRACSLSLGQTPNAARPAAASAGRPPVHSRCVRDSGRLRARLGPQRQRRPPRPGLWAPRGPSVRLLSAPPGQAGALPTPRHLSDLPGAR